LLIACPQPYWKQADDTVTAAPLSNYPSNAEGPAGYNDAPTLLPANEQIAPSPNYSQYLNFDSVDTGTTAGPNNTTSPQSVFDTSPAFAANPQQYAGFPVKVEAEYDTIDSAFSCGLGSSQMQDETLPRTCGGASACLQILENPEVEMEDFNLGDWFPSSSISHPDTTPPRKPSHTVSGMSTETSRRPSAQSSNSSTRKPRKRGRKPSTADDDEDAQARAKQAHSIVERRYRDNLNGKIMQLQRTLSSIASNPKRLDAPVSIAEEETQEQQPTSGTTRVRKSDVMTDAVNYVHQSEVSMRHMTNEINRLTERVRTLEKLVRCEDCVLLKEMVRRSLQTQEQRQIQGGFLGSS
jgi:hypothetical protein